MSTRQQLAEELARHFYPLDSDRAWALKQYMRKPKDWLQKQLSYISDGKCQHCERLVK